MEKKLQIRQINDIQGNSYKIYDIMVNDNLFGWKSIKRTYFTLEDALRFNKGIHIEDISEVRILNNNKVVCNVCGTLNEGSGDMVICSNTKCNTYIKLKVDINKRIEWDKYFMNMAHVTKARSTCLRRQVGAIIVKDRKIVSTGYNGAPCNTSHCLDIGCLRQKLNIPSGERHEFCRGVHAEQNAIIFANSKESLKDATIYVTTSPCTQCAKMLINAGIKRIVADDVYFDDLSIELIEEAGIVLDINKKE